MLQDSPNKDSFKDLIRKVHNMHICDMIWSMEAKVGKYEIEIQAKILSKTKKYIRK